MIDFSLININDKVYNLFDLVGKKGTLIMFICNHCPYVKAIIGRLIETTAHLKDLGINSIAIMSNDTNKYPEDNLKNMKKGDLVFFYHSNEGKEIVGLTKVVKEFYQDPTTDDDKWVVVDLKVEKTLKRPISLTEIKNEVKLKDISLIKQSRLSVMPLDKIHFDHIIKLSDET